MLTILGFSMMIVFTVLIMSKKLSPIVALTITPIFFALIGGFGGSLGDMILEGLQTVASSAALLLFAILFFGILIDAGLFDPLIKKILALVKGDPVKIAIGSAVLAMLIALDGDGTTTYMITVSAMLPLYKRIGMNPLVMATVAMLALSIISGMTPWGGPATRAIAVLGLDPSDFFIPLLPTMLGGIIFVIFTAFMLGLKERKRIGVSQIETNAYDSEPYMAAALEGDLLKRPKLRWINLFLVIAILVLLVMGIMHPAVLFLIGFVLALSINYPNLQVQKERIAEHASNAITVVLLVFAAGVFAGILSGTEMVNAIAGSIVAFVPPSMGEFFPVVVAITSLPLTFVLSNDAYYFGMVPIFAEAASAYGVDPIEIARASILGQPVHLMSPLVASTILLVSMLKIDLGAFQRYAVKWAVLTSLFIILVAIVTGAISFR
ncbi:citrate-Mg2+:H+ or citrate-Ca2+:H+ symporter, CitMHS family [Terribacillus halophilus]|uniref:Citrate-Mg2+:H+ or citrate-Ca2+:H+ symporter, CitMHS family n=1 Tax=Terribacillus halophilus TaxID=361279 RepID=A0A1G6PSR7_9BACI|nr:citrate:proton symporter [Terribacillus halophilus]SDC82437.1 citrate-Mg2+:H+ or citrate-Ca2+:H+ symporter, CitMHS family [Terribacillus halophilus]